MYRYFQVSFILIALMGSTVHSATGVSCERLWGVKKSHIRAQAKQLFGNMSELKKNIESDAFMRPILKNNPEFIKMIHEIISCKSSSCLVVVKNNSFYAAVRVFNKNNNFEIHIENLKNLPISDTIESNRTNVSLFNFFQSIIFSSSYIAASKIEVEKIVIVGRMIKSPFIKELVEKYGFTKIPNFSWKKEVEQIINVLPHLGILQLVYSGFYYWTGLDVDSSLLLTPSILFFRILRLKEYQLDNSYGVVIDINRHY